MGTDETLDTVGKLPRHSHPSTRSGTGGKSDCLASRTCPPPDRPDIAVNRPEVTGENVSLELEREISLLFSSIFALERHVARCCDLVERSTLTGRESRPHSQLTDAIEWMERVSAAARPTLLDGGRLADRLVGL